jgi:hypothetical protein
MQSCGSGFIVSGYGSGISKVNPDSDSDPIRIQALDDQKLKKENTAEIFTFLF